MDEDEDIEIRWEVLEVKADIEVVGNEFGEETNQADEGSQCNKTSPSKDEEAETLKQVTQFDQTSGSVERKSCNNQHSSDESISTLSEGTSKSEDIIHSNEVRIQECIIPKFEDGACFLPQCTFDHKEIVTLQECNHMFFRACLIKNILAIREPTVICPFNKKKLKCTNVLQEAEIKEILSPADFDEYLSISLLIAERESNNAYHCKTPNCIGWCICEVQATTFQCPVCTKTNCLLCKTIHITRPCKQLEDLLNYPNENNTATLSRTKDNAKKLYPKLLDLYRVDLVLYQDEFTCPICFDIFSPMEGIILKSCLHTFCRACLQGVILFCENAEVICPFKDEDYACDSEILESEIKALISPALYEERLAKTFAIAESKIDNAFHCKTPDCKGWCIVEDAASEFHCPLCRRLNCTICAVNHEGETCEQYQGRIHDNCRLGFERSKSEDQIQRLIRQGEAMKCPKCQALIMKMEGCDGLTCPMCRLDICWITKRPRWGPRGKGDYSGGCKCNWKGRKCHPACSNCH